MNNNKTEMRTHACAEITEKLLSKEVTVCGWVRKVRNHGGILFIDVRDRSGIVQVVSSPDNEKVNSNAKKLRREFVVQVKGKVRQRPKEQVNPNMKTGKIEISAEEINILNKAEEPPIEIKDDAIITDRTRLKYKYLDLRRPRMQKNIAFRHIIVKAIRDYFDERGFYEIETPMLVKSTPEGARDFLVPSRINHGHFYALPQSPQIYKQLLMIAGFEKYFQIARCLRDEDLRADRQPEFTQLDVEMSFIGKEDIIKLMEGMFKYVLSKTMNKNIKIPFRRLTYDEAIKDYGLDKPDIRFGLKLIDITELAKKTDSNILKSAKLVKGLLVKKTFSRKEIKELEEFVKIYKARGLFWLKLEDNKLSGNLSKFVDCIKNELFKRLHLEEGCTAFIIADEKDITNSALGELRNKLGRDLKLYNPSQLSFVWITDFPMFEWNEEDKKWDAKHHPFTSPRYSDIKLLETSPEKVKAEAYDIVLNGWEIGGGSIRINRPELQREIFKVLGLSDKEAKEKFGFLIEAFKYGAPPHGGLAIGLDRFIALLLGLEDIRDVIAFPKNKSAENPMDGSPAPVDKKQLDELGLEIKPK